MVIVEIREKIDNKLSTISNLVHKVYDGSYMSCLEFMESIMNHYDNRLVCNIDAEHICVSPDVNTVMRFVILDRYDYGDELCRGWQEYVWPY